MGYRSLPVRKTVHISEIRFCFRFFGVPEDILPEIKSSATIFGYIKKGILQGIPVGAVRKQRLNIRMFIFCFQVLGDQQAALVGQQCWIEGTAKSTLVAIRFVFPLILFQI
jgi:glycerol kinase